jgi:pyruvate kinase
MSGQEASQNQPNEMMHMTRLDIYSEPKTARMTGIICTIGPATNSVQKLVDLIKAGMNCVRLNFSHGTYEYHQSIINNTREAAAQFPDLAVAIALDTKGPEIRLGVLKNDQDITLEKGKEITVTTDDSRKEDGDIHTLWVDYKNLPKVVQIGGFIYIDDGLISLQVLEKTDVSVKCKILNHGKIGSRKGMNLPNTNVDLPAVSEKDKKDLLWGVDQGVDIVFASFIRKAADVVAVREALGPKGKDIKIVSKIENHEGMKNYDEILEASDGIMVARGDLGIEIPLEKVFLAQKMMISRCNIAGKSVICATQMLESMTYNPRPTRAEISDVANAVLDGSDCVMLSGESAKGNYPVETVAMMSRICRESESAIFYSSLFNQLRQNVPKPLSMEEATACSAVNAVYELQVKAIIVLSTTGNSARLVSKYRPPCPILTVTRYAETARQLHLHRGCIPVIYNKPKMEAWQDDVDARIQFGISIAKDRNILRVGDVVIAIQGWKGGVGHTNTVRILTVV